MGDPHTFAHAIIVGVYVGIGRIQYQRVVSCVTAEDTVCVGDVSPCFALGEHFGGKQNHHYRFGSFRGGPHTPPMGHSLVVGGRGLVRLFRTLQSPE
jgi:hypothetical protein